MSTKSTLKHGKGYHLYSDFIDLCQDLDVVNLRLDDVQFTAWNSGVEIVIPSSIARALGLISPEVEASTEGEE